MTEATKTTMSEIFQNIDRRFWPTQGTAVDRIIYHLNTNTFPQDLIKDTARAVELIKESVDYELRSPNLPPALVENLGQQQKILINIKETLDDILTNWRSGTDEIKDRLLKQLKADKDTMNTLLASQKELMKSLPI